MIEVDQNERTLGTEDSPTGRGTVFTEELVMLHKNAKNAWSAAATESVDALNGYFNKLTLSCVRCHSGLEDAGEAIKKALKKRDVVEEIPLPTHASGTPGTTDTSAP